MATSLVFPVLRQVQGVIEVADKCRDDLKDISKYIATLSAVLVKLLGGFEPGGNWEQSILNLLEDVFTTVVSALRLADRCILYDGFGFFAKAAAFGLEREVSRVKEQLRTDLESLNSFLLTELWVAQKKSEISSHPVCDAISRRQSSQAQRLLLSTPKLQTSRRTPKQVAQALAWLRVGNTKAQLKALTALFSMLSTPQWATKATDIISAGGVHAIVQLLGASDLDIREVATRTISRLAQAEATCSPPSYPSEVLPCIIACLDNFTYAQANGFVVVERVQQACNDLSLAALSSTTALQAFAITPANCTAAIQSGALAALADALAAAAAATPVDDCPPSPTPSTPDSQPCVDQAPPKELLHARLVQQLTRTCHLLMLHDPESKQQLLDLGVLPTLITILATQPPILACGTSQDPGPPSAGAAELPHPQLEAARAIVCLAALPAAQQRLEAHPTALPRLREVATMYQSCFAGAEVGSWLGPKPDSGEASNGEDGEAAPQGQEDEEVAGGAQQQAAATAVLSSSPLSWLGMPGRAMMSVTAAASCAVLQVWQGPGRAVGQQHGALGAVGEGGGSERWGIGSGDADQILMDMKLSDME